MLKIRLQRIGRTHEPSFRLVLTDSKNSTKSGRFKEVLGSYDPRKTRDVLQSDRIQYWLSQGASATPTVHNLLVTHKVIGDKKIHVASKSKHAPIEAPEKSPQAPVVDTTVSEPVIPAEAPAPEVENAIIEETPTVETVEVAKE